MINENEIYFKTGKNEKTNIPFKNQNDTYNLNIHSSPFNLNNIHKNNLPNQISIRKSKKDTNEYKFIILKNKLRCLLIYDKDADKSAAAMTVNIGSLCDPKEYEGLAHFLEHMLFMGTEKYPDENDFSEFLSKNSGDSNAYTDLDSTQYYFDVKNEKFVEALDRFSYFFKKPLFNKSAVEREMKAVESEHVKNIKNDDDRFLEILRSESHPSTPFAKFQTGSLATLKKPYIRKNLKQFYKSHYSSNLMSLCVISRIPLDELEKIVKILFEEVEEISTDIHEIRQEFIPESIYPYNEDFNLNYFYRILNIRENSTLSFYWMLNENLNLHYKSSPLEYVTNLLEHEGKNSLASSLTKDQFISDLEACYDVIAHTYTQVYITVTLTAKGFENYLEIIKRVLLYIKKIQTFEINREFFEEYQRMSYVDFDYFEKDEPVDFCSELSNNILLYQPEDIISGGYIVEEYNPCSIKKYLDMLNVKNLNVYFCSNKFEKDFNCFVSGKNNQSMEIDGSINCKYSKVFMEKHYGTKFTKEKYDFENFLTANEQYIEDYGFSLPPSNVFIPKNFELKDFTKFNAFTVEGKEIISDNRELSENQNMKTLSSFSLISNSPNEIVSISLNYFQKYPKLILSKENKYNIWYKHDTKFQIPKAFLFCQIYLSKDVFNYSYEELKNGKNEVNLISDFHIDYFHYKTYIDLWFDFLHKEMRETIYLAAIAKIDFQLYVNNFGLTLELSGFNDSLNKFVKEIAALLQKYSNIRSIENFKEKLLTIIENNIRSIKNSFKSSASTQVSLKLNSLITTPHSDRKKVLLILEELRYSLSEENFYSYQPFKKLEYFLKNFFKKSFFEWLIQGNIFPEEGMQIIEIFHSHFKSDELKLMEINQIRTVKLSPEINFFYNFESEEENNSAIISYFQLGYLSEKEACIVELIEKLLQEKFFDEMRTKQALGYSVYLRHEYNRKISGICCMVQSNVQNPEYIHAKINDFFIDYSLTDEENLTEEDFQKYVDSIISDLKKKDINLAEEVNRNFEEIMIREYVFNRNEERIKIYENEIKKKDVVEFFEEHFLNNVKRLDVELVAKKHKEQNEKNMKKNLQESNGNMNGSGFVKQGNVRIQIKSDEAFKRICEVYPDYYYYIKLK